MGRLNVIIAYNSWSQECEPMGIFGGRYDWKMPELSDKFCNTISIMTDRMAGDFEHPRLVEGKPGAVPGILAFCPTVIPIRGNSLMRHLANHIADTNNDIVATVFADANTYKSILECGSIEHVWVVTDDGSNPGWEQRKFKYRGWAESEDNAADPEDGLHIREYCRADVLNIEETDMMAEIERIEGELNEKERFDEDLTDDDKVKLSHLYANIDDVWALFSECGKNIMDYLSFAREKAADMLPDGVEMPDMPDGMEEMLDTMNAPGMDAPASIGLVQMVANQVKALADMVVETKQLAKDNGAKLSTMDMAMCDSVKSMEATVEGMKSYTDEALSGLRRQLGLVILKQRLKSWIPAVCAAISAICCVITVFAR